MSRVAMTSVNALTVHCRPESPASRSRPMDGSATLTIVMSRPTMNRLRQQIARMRAFEFITIMNI